MNKLQVGRGDGVAPSDLQRLLRKCFDNPTDKRRVSSFYCAFKPYLLAILAAMYPQDYAIVEDALQAAFVKFLVLFKTNRDHGQKNVGYFVVIARHCLIDEVRKRRGRIAFDQLAESEMCQGVSSDEDVMWCHVVVSAAMMHVDQKCRFVLESYYIQERDPKLIALDLGISHQSFYVTLQRCRESLRAVLSSKADAPSNSDPKGEKAPHLKGSA